MRALLLATAALALAQSAWAQPLSPEQISFSPEFQTALDEEYGAREGRFLRDAVAHAINDALARRGVSQSAGGPGIEVSIIDAQPNRPTMQQLVDTPGLDPMRSISIGGAELHAVLRGADGSQLAEVDHRRFDFSLEDLNGAVNTWTAARRAIRRFGEKVADAYVAHASAR